MSHHLLMYNVRPSPSFEGFEVYNSFWFLVIFELLIRFEFLVANYSQSTTVAPQAQFHNLVLIRHFELPYHLNVKLK